MAAYTMQDEYKKSRRRGSEIHEKDGNAPVLALFSLQKSIFALYKDSVDRRFFRKKRRCFILFQMTWDTCRHAAI